MWLGVVLLDFTASLFSVEINGAAKKLSFLQLNTWKQHAFPFVLKDVALEC